MSFYTGRTGELKLDGVSIAKIRDWSVETTVELLSTNTIDSKVNTFTPGVMGATGSATIMYYREANSLNVQSFFDKVMKTSGGVEEGDTVSMELVVDGGTNTDKITFNAYITSASLGVSTGELVSASVNFTVDGNFTSITQTGV